jgi:hypothetical protein
MAENRNWETTFGGSLACLISAIFVDRFMEYGGKSIYVL